MKPLNVGDKVRFKATNKDPAHLECSPQVLIAEVQDAPGAGPDGKAYKVRHDNVGTWVSPTYGPYPRTKLVDGW